MNRAKLLAQRKALLIAECALQRVTLVTQTRSLSHVPNWLKISGNLVTRLKTLPGWVSAVLAGLVVFMPGRSMSLVKKGLALWQVWRAISPK